MTAGAAALAPYLWPEQIAGRETVDETAQLVAYRALYQAKDDGRNQVQLADDDPR